MDRSFIPAPADWQLPPGVSRPVWDYLHDSTLPCRYDDALAGTPLLDIDLRFVAHYCQKPVRILDLGCGTGRMSIPLARQGHSVVGVDLSEPMLQRANEKALDAGASVRWVRANIVELDCLVDQSFDVVLCLFSTLGMIAGGGTRQRVVQNAFQLLKPGGYFLLHVHNRWHHLRTSVGRRWLVRDILRTLAHQPGAGDFAMPANDQLPGWIMHLFTLRETSQLLRHAGFRIDAIQPVAASSDGRLMAPWWLPRLRAYGYLIAARRPN